MDITQVIGDIVQVIDRLGFPIVVSILAFIAMYALWRGMLTLWRTIERKDEHLNVIIKKFDKTLNRFNASIVGIKEELKKDREENRKFQTKTSEVLTEVVQEQKLARQERVSMREVFEHFVQKQKKMIDSIYR